MILLDTNIVIDILTKQPHPDMPALTRPAVAAITAAELYVGAVRGGVHRERRLAGVEAFLGSVVVLDYTRETARMHADLLAHVRDHGTPRGAHDLIIAAHAAEQGARIITRDAKARFGDLPGVSATILAKQRR